MQKGIGLLRKHIQRSHKIVTNKGKPQSEEDLNEINISDEESNQNENIENILPIGAAFDLRRKLLLNLNDRFSKVEEHPILSVATLLDPRYKKIHFHQESNVEAAIGRIAKYLEKINQTSNDEPPPPPPKRSRDSNCLWQIHDDLVDSQNETIIVNEDNI
ncbi:uncharacterized protein LOC119607036 isoform X2 [Lucilia sericata]|uniref:uncharacterized protein LOC119607036 isoform X2 n=1 Tax=Lucilia sericata TaxID=13632 RepID=UPI0018A8837C|nr:uncharacterized protein LOC119607036 isoform X2 [Lucilia sericata]